jgi:N-acyl homoserine lactone hydrolase
VRVAVERVYVADVTKLPPSHPLTHGYAVYAYLIHHPDGAILVDTGIGSGMKRLEDLYAPVVHPWLFDAGSVVGVVNTHLHFDHCGRNADFPSVPVYVQADEVAAARAPRYTIPEWADVDNPRMVALSGDCEIAPGVRVLATPGHTPGHQSVLVDSDPPALIVGQAAFDADEFLRGAVDPTNVDEEWRTVGQASLDRLRSVARAVAVFSHDERTVAITRG